MEVENERKGCFGEADMTVRKYPTGEDPEGVFNVWAHVGEGGFAIGKSRPDWRVLPYAGKCGRGWNLGIV